MLTKDFAICIRAVDYSETSQIVTFFARSAGKISTIAKGSKRPKSPFGGPIEIFSCGNIVFSDTGADKLATLAEFEPIFDGQDGTGLQNDLFTLNCCFFAVELLGKLTEDYDPHPELFDIFLQFLRDVKAGENRHRILALLVLFQLAMLKEIGVQPVLYYCTNCKTSYQLQSSGGEIFFSSQANGMICRDCQGAFPDRIRLSQPAANCLADLKMIAHVQLQTLNEIEKILIAHFTGILGHQPKMIKYFQKTFR